MKLFSTRNQKLECSSLDALIQPLASDGGLWMFESFPFVDWKVWVNDPFKLIVGKVLDTLIEEMDKELIIDAINHAYNQFSHPEIVHSIILKHQVVELFHGPSAAFKDIALSLLPELTKIAYKQANISRLPHILTATSGDTGSAALVSFGASDFDITVFYPEIGISALQRKQMTCVNFEKVRVYGIKGNFDDAQRVVKHLFKQDSIHRFGSANSINIGRLVPQIAYYFKAYGDSVRCGRIMLGDSLSFAVPSGNFGNAFAGYCAMRLGLPIKHIIIGSNGNDVLTDFFNHGIYDANKQFKHTQSPSMDILISSNLERLLYAVSDSDYVKTLMNDLDIHKKYEINDEIKYKLFQHFKAYSISEIEMSSTIKNVFEHEQYCLDPHSAIAWASAEHYQMEFPDQVIVVLLTASPYKFPGTVLSALGIETSFDDFDNLERLNQIINTPIPTCLSSLKDKIEVHTQILSIKHAEKLYD
jgi:threonine synthase